MPRRNSNAVQTVRKPRSTHVLIDTVTGRRIEHGTKSELLLRAEELNALIHTWRYHIKPIHK